MKTVDEGSGWRVPWPKLRERPCMCCNVSQEVWTQLSSCGDLGKREGPGGGDKWH